MKNALTVLAMAATAAATGFRDANPFSCPGNTDNKCTDKQSSGFDFSDLGFGDFSSYNNFNWKGWSCGSDSGKRFAPRTLGKKISASCHTEKEKSPSFGCGANIDKFSLGAITLKPEFTCELEFHYDMPDGSTCKHRSRCDKSGTTVKNSQCGGAKNVTIVYPPQDKPKTTCSVDVHTISFECSTKTKPPKTTTKATTATTSTGVVTTTSETKGIETTTSPSATETTSTTALETTSTTAVETTSPTGVETTSPPVTTKPPFGNSTITSVETASTTAETTSETTKTFVTSFQSTSTVFTTSTQTITSCAETVTNCPANSVVTTVVTVAVSTTICPVTETRTTVLTNTQTTAKATETTAVGETTTKVEETTKVGQTTSTTAAVGTTTTGGGTGEVGTTETGVTGVTTTTTSVTAVETLPCPNVVPQCLNTFMFSVGCSDNSDSTCYCPDEIFVKNIFDCIYAHGETAQIVSEAVIFFQGICAPYAPSNPAIVTGATITSFVTVSATATTSLAPVYTTVTVQATTVVPCTDAAGSTIPSSSSTIVISTEMTVPQVGFSTGTGTGKSVGLVPITTTTAAAVTGEASTTAGTTNTLVTAPPVGTGSVRPTQTGLVTVSSGGRVSAGFGLALAVMGLVAAL